MEFKILKNNEIRCETANAGMAAAAYSIELQAMMADETVEESNNSVSFVRVVEEGTVCVKIIREVTMEEIPQSEKTQYAYSHDGERYMGTFNTVEAAQTEGGGSCWIGEVVPYKADSFLPDASDIVDHMVNAATGEGPEASEDYLEGITPAQLEAITNELTPAMVAIFKRHGVDLKPSFFGIKNEFRTDDPSPLATAP